MGVSEAVKKDKGVKSLFKKIMTENFPNLGEKMDIQIHETHRTPKMLNLKSSTSKQNIIKLSKSKTKREFGM